jgi:DNA polymerase III subunit epsilon
VDFIALDFETATSQPDSACEMGLAIVRGGVVREIRSWLIKPRQWPYFSPFAMAVHGIRPDDVDDAPMFDKVWAEAGPLFNEAIVVAHNAAFDLNVLRSTLASHDLPMPSFSYFCSVVLSRRVWPGHPRYDLRSMCDLHEIRFKHHRAGNDAEAAAELVIRAGERLEVSSTVELLKVARVKRGVLSPVEHRTPGGKVTALV